MKQLCASAAPAELVGHQGGLLPAPGLPIACAQKNFGRAVPAIAASPNNERRTTGLSTIEDQRDRRIGQGTERIGAAIEDQRDRRIGQAYWSVGERIRKNQNHPSEQRIGQGTPRSPKIHFRRGLAGLSQVTYETHVGLVQELLQERRPHASRLGEQHPNITKSHHNDALRAGPAMTP